MAELGVSPGYRSFFPARLLLKHPRVIGVFCCILYSVSSTEVKDIDNRTVGIRLYRSGAYA